MEAVPVRAVQRLSLYRRILLAQAAENRQHLFSYTLASLANVTPELVRRDLMYLSITGTAPKGYCVQTVIDEIGRILDSTEPVNMALVGVGNLGKAILVYSANRQKGLDIRVVFDIDPAKIGRYYHECPCRHLRELPEAVATNNITIGIVTTPVSSAQTVADILIASGITGIVNFAPTSLKAPKGVYVENVDITMAFEKTAFVTRQLG